MSPSTVEYVNPDPKFAPIRVEFIIETEEQFGLVVRSLGATSERTSGIPSSVYTKLMGIKEGKR